jgi:hypothetical protein
MENACKEFLRALSKAEQNGGPVAVGELAKQLSSMPPGATPDDIFHKCKENGWVMGSTNGPWLTPQGRRQATSD